MAYDNSMDMHVIFEVAIYLKLEIMWKGPKISLSRLVSIILKRFK